MTTTTRRAPAVPPESEAQFSAAFRNLAILLHWRAYHTHRSDRSEPGFPDWVLVKDGRLLFVELKRVGGKPTLEQRLWLDALRQVPGIEVWLWTPADWPTITRVLRDPMPDLGRDGGEEPTG